MCDLAEELGVLEEAGLTRPARTRFGNRQPRSIESYGLHDSGAPATLFAVAPPQQIQRVKVMTVALPMDTKNAGLATVHVSVSDASDRVLTSPTNQRVILDVEWETGRGGGGAQIDATQGAVWTMAGGHVVNVYATLLANEADPATGELLPLVPGQDKVLEGAVQWGSTTFQAAYMTSPRLAFVRAGKSAIGLPIPPQAARLQLVSDSAGVTLTADLANADGTDVIYSADFNRLSGNANKVPVVAGAETLFIEASAACKALAIWELWL
jgi:hypothetical protein